MAVRLTTTHFTALCAALWLLIFTTQLRASDWQTLHTEHFRVHYTPAQQAWARSAAIELELVRNRVLQQQGRALNSIADVVVFDPINGANGFALPSTDSPLMALFTTPPQSNSVIANSPGWQQLLILHEYIHLVHLSQPSRSGWRQHLRDWFDIYDLASAVLPRWVAEGYATLLESRLTGRGRLYDNYSEALLRNFARQGALLSYGALSDGDGSYRSSAMAYLLGVRFLAWLEDNHGKERLDAVWTRVHGVRKRSFEGAFKGVYGQSAAQLYRRFIAEYTYQAMARERDLDTLNSPLWLEFDYAASDPVMSPDGTQLVVTERNQEGEHWLRVYKTEDNTEAQKAFDAAQQAILAADPADIADKPPAVFKRELVAELDAIDFAGMQYPQWQSQETIYFVARARVDETRDNRVNDLYRWHIPSNEVTRLTRALGIRRFTLHDQDTLYAEQVRDGFSELVRLEVGSNTVTPLSERSLGTVYDYPQLAPDGRQLAYLKTTLNGNWQLYIQDLQSAVTRRVPMPQGYQYLTAPAWQHDGLGLYFIAGLDGQLGIYRYDLTHNRLYQVTFGQAVFEQLVVRAAQPLLYAHSTPLGTRLHALDSQVSEQRVTALSEDFAVPLGKTDPVVLPDAQIYDPDDTAVTHSDYQWLAQNASAAISAQASTASSELLSVGLKGSDLLQQLSWQLGLAQSSDNVLTGSFAALRYRSGDWRFDAHLSDYRFDGRRQHGDAEQIRLDGMGLSTSLSYEWRFDTLTLAPFAAITHYDDEGHQAITTQWAGLEHGWHKYHQDFALGYRVKAAFLSGNATGHGYDWQGFSKVWNWPWFAGVQSQYRTSQAVRLGGFDNNLLSGRTRSDLVLSPELPFQFATGRHYYGYELASSWALGQPRIFIKHHRLDGQRIAKSYGVKWRLDLSQQALGWANWFAPAGVTDLRFDLGIARVESDLAQDTLRAWLGLWYAL
ncbi:hypothetical protein [Pseudoalteromonas sp. OOF1S-7]|uniref:TolB family protein n=1 Tax=Pseudoalteromonas sp. OOF1S-7 TaxID=2917757 RepID=UPI001EF6BC0E|nr:hypothetical protein [Pseudoalteromonas sp. OOF1S-7]MCG7536071.1 hypothetical protein [Pseudoalteromonas sp. OOF1S-7]